MSNVQVSRKRPYRAIGQMVRSYLGRPRVGRRVLGINARRYSGYKKRGSYRGNIPHFFPGKPTLSWTGPGMIPERFFTTARYRYYWKAGAAGYGDYGFYDWIIRGNSIYDPDYSFGGESCLGLAEIAYLYQKYKVYSATLRVHAVNNDVDDPISVTVIPWEYSGSVAYTQNNAIRGMPLAKSMVVANQAGQNALTYSMRTATIKGVHNLDDAGFAADMTHDPSHEWYFHIIISNGKQTGPTTGTALNTDMWLEVDYHVEFSNHYAMTQ